ncbi:MAG: DUF1887 family CARF protein [Caldilineaceae bacterium]
MITIETIPDECKTEHLFLLIGSNPLPNYVAAMLLRRPNTVFYLIHTSSTFPIAEGLRNQLADLGERHETSLLQVDATDSESISNGIEAQLRKIPPRATIGLNYTGGTKAMAVHSYRILETKRGDTVFTYLDAQTLSLFIVGSNAQATRKVSVRQRCEIPLKTVMQLHGYTRYQSESAPNWNQTNRKKLVSTIAILTINPESYKQWKEYTAQKPLDTLPDLNQWPALSPFVEQVRSICGADADTLQLSLFLEEGKKSSSCRTWLQGGWLEEYTIDAIDSVRKVCELTDLGMNLKPTKQGNDNSFELDIAAMRGYQLLSLSCIVSDVKDSCQEHFFEAYIRARQFGGEEAHAALICFYAKPAQLERTISENWLTQGHTKVFGREHLPNLPAHLKEWVQNIDAVANKR